MSNDEGVKRGYRPISDYAMIGDMISGALVAADGAIDWCCWPRFDSPGIFHRLLDAEHGGHFTIQPVEPFESEQQYLERTNVVCTKFTTSSGVLSVTDFMPLRDGGPHDDDPDAPQTASSIVRRVEALSGAVEVQITFRPGFDWGRTPPRFSKRPWGWLAEGGDGKGVGLVCPLEVQESDDGALTARATVRPGSELWIGAHYLADPDGRPPLDGDPATRHALEQTTDFWRQWIDRCSYDGPYGDLVRRSALTLKLLTYAPSGALVAAPTTSLPETLGGVRNWDYRYVWLRDAALTLRELQDLGYHDEAMAFWDWLEEIELAEQRELHHLYRVDGGTDVPEEELDHLDGYCGSKPVRLGNAAADQLQLDVYGYILESAYLCQTRMREPHPDLKPILAALTDAVIERWQEPDQGIWEVRGEPRHYIHSKLRCWVALDRALKLNERGWLDGDRDLWRKSRQEIREFIESRGYNTDIGSFTQYPGTEQLDATALMIPILGFLPADDPRVLSTIDQIRDRLTENGFVRRYSGDDGLPGKEGAFVMCTFWLVAALAHSGQTDDARELFDQLAACANGIGLFSEEIDPATGTFLGNFPQGFSHLALIDAALALQP